MRIVKEYEYEFKESQNLSNHIPTVVLFTGKPTDLKGYALLGAANTMPFELSVYSAPQNNVNNCKQRQSAYSSGHTRSQSQHQIERGATKVRNDSVTLCIHQSAHTVYRNLDHSPFRLEYPSVQLLRLSSAERNTFFMEQHCWNFWIIKYDSTTLCLLQVLRRLVSLPLRTFLVLQVLRPPPS